MVDILSDASTFCAHAFTERYERGSRPCLLRGLLDRWPAYAQGLWRPEALMQRFPAFEWDQGLESGVATTLASFFAEHHAAAAVDARGGASEEGDSESASVSAARQSAACESAACESAFRESAARQSAACVPGACDTQDLLPARYIFDASFGEALPELCNEYETPHLFPTDAGDYLAVLSPLPALRPRYRWLLVGVPGSGFTLHQDPFSTSAWNALLVGGRKRWVLLPPHTPLATVLPALAAAVGEGAEEGAASAGAEAAPALAGNPLQPQEPPPYWSAPEREDGDSEGGGEGGAQLEEGEASAAAWCARVLPRLRARAAELGLLEFEQAPGEVVFIPQGWWHVALTLRGGEGQGAGGSDGGGVEGGVEGGCRGRPDGVTVAVTHNYLPACAFEGALMRLAERPGGAASARNWCLRAAAAGMAEGERCLRLPQIAGGSQECGKEGGGV